MINEQRLRTISKWKAELNSDSEDHEYNSEKHIFKKILKVLVEVS